MKLRRLCKAETSTGDDDYPAMYIADPPFMMVAQGERLDVETTAQLLNLALTEGGLAIPTETVMRSVALLLAEHGRPAMIAEVESFLAEMKEAWA